MQLSSLSALAQTVLAPFSSIDLPAPAVFTLDETALTALRCAIVLAIENAQQFKPVKIYALLDDLVNATPVSLDAGFADDSRHTSLLIATCSHYDDDSHVLAHYAAHDLIAAAKRQAADNAAFDSYEATL